MGSRYFKYSLIHAEDFTRAKASTTATEATSRATRQTSLNLETKIIPRTKLELGYLFAGSEKLDETFYYYENGNVYQDKIELLDTQGVKAKVSSQCSRRAAYSTPLSTMPAWSLMLEIPCGNSIQPYPIRLWVINWNLTPDCSYPVGNFWLLPRGLYRKNLMESNPSLEPYIDGADLFPGLSPRNRDKDPFAVLDNREALAGEFFLTYDPTPASYFYAWDSGRKEDAGFAFSIGGNVTRYETVTDANLFFYQEGNTNAPFGSGMPAEDVWLAKGRFILNPNPGLENNRQSRRGKTAGVRQS